MFFLYFSLIFDKVRTLEWHNNYFTLKCNSSESKILPKEPIAWIKIGTLIPFEGMLNHLVHLAHVKLTSWIPLSQGLCGRSCLLSSDCGTTSLQQMFVPLFLVGSREGIEVWHKVSGAHMLDPFSSQEHPCLSQKLLNN